MSYVPPHARTKSGAKSGVKIFKQEFPQLAPPIIEKPKLDFSKLFKNAHEKREKKANKMKWGTIKLTKEGIIDSLTVEEREYETYTNEQTLINWNLLKMHNRIEADTIKRMADDPNYEPYVLESSSSEEEWVSDDTESIDAEDPEEDEI